MSKPVDTQEFWKQRLIAAHANGRGVHSAIYDIDIEVWQNIQSECIEVLKMVPDKARVLDVGCGYGALRGRFLADIEYTGIDISVDLIEVAKLSYPHDKFIVGDARNLPFANDAFDWAIGRSMQDMLVNNLGMDYWVAVEKEMLRVAHNVLLIEYEGEVTWKVLRRN